MRRHIDIIAYLHIAQSVLVLLAAGVMLLLMLGSGLFAGDPTAAFTLSAVGLVAGFFLLLIALPGFVVGYGLLKRRPWGRIGGLVMGALDLFNFPFGTALGVYTFWALLAGDADRIFSSSSRQHAPRR